MSKRNFTQRVLESRGAAPVFTDAPAPGYDQVHGDRHVPDEELARLEFERRVADEARRTGERADRIRRRMQREDRDHLLRELEG